MSKAFPEALHNTAMTAPARILLVPRPGQISATLKTYHSADIQVFIYVQITVGQLSLPSLRGR